ncbi:MAG: hypothetical protein IJI83_02910 [Oscillospiraceae bacterium]|nr:hypothetical protein [Oscillospiraceae bacterium]
MIESFSNLINQYFKQKKTIPEFVRENYSPHEYATKDRTIRRYLSGEVVPQYHAAKELVEKLDIEISENELMEILNYSRTERETNIDYKHSYLFEKISARTTDLFKDSDYLEYEIQNMFTERVNEATAGDVKKYLIALVEYDLENRPENIFGNRSQKSEYDKIEGEIKE